MVLGLRVASSSSLYLVKLQGGGKFHATNMSLMNYAFDDDVGDFEFQPMVAYPSHK